jgi:hypothetical protein
MSGKKEQILFMADVLFCAKKDAPLPIWTQAMCRSMLERRVALNLGTDHPSE